jgi:phosphate transport system substrate-binding protein
MYRIALTAVVALLVVAGTASARPAALGGTIAADGSSTVGPFTTAAAEMFTQRNPNVRITVGISGTGGGFERFCRGETDLSNASRGIRNSEHLTCLQNGVKWVAFTVANDGISIVANKDNTWADCLTTAELKTIWDSGSKVTNWNQIRASFPNVPLRLFGPGTDSGTFDFFTEVINGRAKRSRPDYLASEDDNILVQGVSGERGGLGYFGFSYYEENADKLKLIRVDNGKGCTAPSVATVQKGQYKPLARPLFIYAKRSSFARAEVRSFIGYIFNNERVISKRAGYISLTDKQLKKARNQFRIALSKKV